MRDSNYQIVINNNWFVEIDEWIFQFFPEDIRKSLDPKKIDSFKNYRQDNGKFIVMSNWNTKYSFERLEFPLLRIVKKKKYCKLN